MCSPRAVSRFGGQRRSGTTSQCGPPSLAPACRGFAQADPARFNAVGGCGGPIPASRLDSPTSVGSTLRSFPWFRPSQRFCLLLAHRVRCGRITAGEGRTDSHAMPGGDHPTSVSPELSFPHFSLATNQGGTNKQRSSFNEVFSPSEPIMRAKILCPFPPGDFFLLAFFLLPHCISVFCDEADFPRTSPA